MPCYFPLQASFFLREDGKKQVKFSNSLAKNFYEFGLKNQRDSDLSLPCGKCLGCRLERSRQWGVRCMHEASMHEHNCFITLTFDDEHLASMCPTGSLSKSHLQKFLKRLRKAFNGNRIRFFGCGEYGETFQRPHYHVCLFGVDFVDRRYWQFRNGNRLDVSDTLSVLWPYGFSTVGDVTFESAAYVARYCTKKVSGDEAVSHYAGRLPEFMLCSLKPGIGRSWIDKFGSSDVFPHDNVVVRGVECKPPRYYDKVLEKNDVVAFEKLKESRALSGKERADDNTSRRLKDKYVCKLNKLKSLFRSFENGSC